MKTATIERRKLTAGNNKLGDLYRDVTVERQRVNEESRTIELSFSSEVPYERWWGVEILDHASSSIRLGRLNNGGALLVDHDPADHVGVVEKAEIGTDRKGRALVRFGKSQRADEIFRDVVDGIRSLVSVGYRIHKMVLEKQEEDSETYRVVDWEPFEISIVAVPADPSVGVGRTSEEDFETQVIRKENVMDKEVTAPVVDIKVIEAEATKKEQRRVAELIAIGDKFKMPDLARDHIGKGTSVEMFRETVLDKLQETGVLKIAENPSIGLTEKEKGQYSFCRALLAIKEPQNIEAQRAAAFEHECSVAARNKMGNVRKEREVGMTIPNDVLNMPLGGIEGMNERAVSAALRALFNRIGVTSAQRDLTVGTATAGGHTVATDLLGASFIELLINSMVIMSMGPTMLRDLNGNIAIPRQTSGTTAYWVAENSAVTESQAAFDQVTLSPKTVGGFSDYSRRLLLQSSLDVEGFVRMDLARTIALELDRAAINGSGASNQPTGILNTSGIGSVAGGANGAAPTWDHIVDLESAVANANAADIGRMGYLTNTKVRGKLKRTQMFGGTNGIPVWEKGADPLNGYRAGVSNNVPSNLDKGTSVGVCSAIIFGNFAELLIGLWGGLDVLLDPYAGATAGTKRVVVLQDTDIAVRHAVSFAAMKDALTT